MQIKRIAARHMILDLANTAKIFTRRTLYMKHINQAVFRCRQRGLVGPELLETAGFRAKASA
jgi:hypothetical protein